MKIGPELLRVFLNEFKTYNQVLSEIDLDLLQKKYEALFKPDNISSTMCLLVTQSEFMDFSTSTPTRKNINKLRNAVSFLNGVIKNTDGFDDAAKAFVSYYLYKGTSRLQNDMQVSIIKLKDRLPRGDYHYYLSEIKQTDNILMNLNQMMLSFITQPMKVLMIDQNRFGSGFRLNILLNIVNGIQIHSTYSYILHFLNKKEEALGIITTCVEQLKIVESNLKVFCEKTFFEYSSAKKQLKYAQGEVQKALAVVSSTTMPPAIGYCLTELESLIENDKRQIPAIDSNEWAAILVQYLDKLNTAYTTKIYEENEESLLREICEMLPVATVAIDNPEKVIKLLTAAKAICLEIRNIYVQKSKNLEPHSSDYIQYSFIVDRIEILIKQYITKIAKLSSLKSELFAYDLIVDILDLDCTLQRIDECQIVLKKHAPRYFADPEMSKATINNLLAHVEYGVPRFCPSVYFHVLHFMTKVLPESDIARIPHFYDCLSQQLVNRSEAVLALWKNHDVIPGFYHRLEETIYSLLTVGKQYKDFFKKSGYSFNNKLFMSLDVNYALFLFEIGNVNAFRERRAALQVQSAEPANDIEKNSIFMQLARLNERNAQGVTSDAQFYQGLLQLYTKLEKVKFEVETDAVVERLTGDVPSLTPLMRLEDILRKNDNVLLALESLLSACDDMNEIAFRYERKSFLVQLETILILWIKQYTLRNKCALDELIIEKISDVLKLAKQIYANTKEFSDIPEAIQSSCAKFVERIADLSWENLNDELVDVHEEFKDTLFASRKSLSITLSQMRNLMNSKHYATNVKILHSLINIIEATRKAFGRMDYSTEQLEKKLLFNLCSCSLSIGMAIYDKRVDNYHEALMILEGAMRLLEMNMPRFQAKNPYFSFENSDNLNEDEWLILQSLCAVYVMYGFVNIMQGQFIRALNTAKIAEVHITKLAATIKTEKQSLLFTELELNYNKLKACFIRHKDTSALAQLVNALQRMSVCEKQISYILEKIKKPSMWANKEVVIFDKPQRTHLFEGFTLVVNGVMRLPECQQHLIKSQLKELIERLAEYQKIFSNTQSNNSLCMVELLSEKLAKCIPLLQAAWSELPEIEEPSVERLATLLSKTSIDTNEKQENAVATSSQTNPTSLHFTKEAKVLRLVPTLTEDAPEIHKLLTEAQAITANIDDLEHFYLFESYKDSFAAQAAVTTLIKAAIKKVSQTSSEIKIQQSNVNLAHFILLYFAKNLAANHKIKMACFDLLWTNLTGLLDHLMLDFTDNRIPVGQCLQALEQYELQKNLYEYYLLQPEIVSDRERFLPLNSDRFQQTELLMQSTSELRQQLVACNQQTLTKTITELTRPFETSSLEQRSVIGEIRQIIDISSENIEKINRFLEKLQDPSSRHEAVECFKSLVKLLTRWRDRNKKLKIEPFAERLLTECLQKLLDHINQAIPQIVVHKTEQVNEETKLIEQFDKLTINKPSQLIMLEALFNDILNFVRTCSEVKEAYVVGGAIRDTLLGVKPHDVDLYIKCELAAFLAHFKGDAYQPAPHKRPELVRFHSLDDQGKKHDIICTAGECPYEPDLTINSLRWDGKQLLDPLNCLADLSDPYLRRIGSSEAAFQSDPSKILRTIRLSHHSNKMILPDELPVLIANAPRVTTLEMGLYLSNVMPLFLRSLQEASLNINFLIRHQLWCCILPTPLCEDPTFLSWVNNQYLQTSLFQLYMQYNNAESFTVGTRYELLAIFLIPVLLGRQPNESNKSEKINELVNDYCKAYLGFGADKDEMRIFSYKLKACLSRALKPYQLVEPSTVKQLKA